MTIRKLEPDDAAAVVELLRATDPLYLGNEATFRHRLAHVPQRARRGSWVAFEGDRLVGYAIASTRFWTSVADSGTLDVCVLADARGRGAGAALYDRAEQHLREIGVRRAWAVFTANDAGERFARRRGFEPVRVDRISAIDPCAFTEALPRVEGFDAVPLAVLRDRPREIFDVEAEVVGDIPLSEPFRLEYETWLREDWTHPLLDFDVSTVVLQGERAVGFAQVRVDRESGRADNSFTATRREVRGLGLARLAKVRSLQAAAALGITSMTTANDERNAPMLAVNKRLGYQPIATRAEWRREL